MGASFGSIVWIFLKLRKHFVHSLRRTNPVVVLIRALCKFGLKTRGVRRLEWDTLCPYITPLPQDIHFIAIGRYDIILTKLTQAQNIWINQYFRITIYQSF